MSRPQQRRQTRRGSFPTRRSQPRKEKTTILLVCEGRKTEPGYFHALKLEDDVVCAFTVTVKKGRGGSRLRIVDNARKHKDSLRAPPDETWCVMDVEALQSPESRTDFEDAIKLANANNIILCLSNPAFEVWPLAHFKRTSRHFNDCDAVITELNKHWKECFGNTYEKAADTIYKKLSSRTQTAATHAKDVLRWDHGGCSEVAKCNSSTEVYRLVEKLLDLG
ncbi:MAG: hypothetical protein GWP08_16365 [Nitrospiraceae bacterium]|nr:hypothetical protein [Nitrospiraceae bacterium]